MRKSKIAVVSAGLLVITIASGFDTLFPYGIAGRTGSPGETTCVYCHTSFPLNDGTGSVTISSPDLIGWEYQVGQTYTINVTVARMGNPVFGFDCECLDTANQNGGTFVVTNSQTQINSATILSVVRENMVHTMNGGLDSNSHTFSFKWIAPATNVGDVKFWVTGNAANLNYAPSGDHIYSTSQIVTPMIGTSVALSTENNPEFTISPNPAHDNLSLIFSTSPDENVNIQLISVEGKEIALLHHQIADGTPQHVQVNLPSDLQHGIYLVRLLHGTTSVTRRIIIQ